MVVQWYVIVRDMSTNISLNLACSYGKMNAILNTHSLLIEVYSTSLYTIT